MPIKVLELEKEGNSVISIRGKTLNLLKKNQELAYTLKEIYLVFLNDHKDKNKNLLYKLIYNYLHDFTIKGLIIHKGNYYYYNKKYGKKNN